MRRARLRGHSWAAMEEALGRCWRVTQVRVADTSERAGKEYRVAMMWYYRCAVMNGHVDGRLQEQRFLEVFRLPIAKELRGRQPAVVILNHRPALRWISAGLLVVKRLGG